ncbi:leucyl/phenylalanyl-tRNA--protein transferase [Methyloligella solikamskensis]|uniref:Leucyl/phenylalanyl-tRNA--protein transferase n=1 Tax=Methyloligella solikamskensis TaxID=1177756 RepID=A0ABW3JB64_9HYPH
MMVFGEVPATLGLMARQVLGQTAEGRVLPDPNRINEGSEGLAGLCGDLDVSTLLSAYAKGFYPRSTFGPQKWWAPEERMVLFLEQFQLGSRIARKLAGGFYRIGFDESFGEVVEACARPNGRQGKRRWIRADLSAAFREAHDAGVAHSVEVRDFEGNLVGGAYGLAVGKVFFTEAQFSMRPDAGRMGLAALNCHLQARGFLANDAKHLSGTLCQQGFCLVPRGSFNRFLEKACAGPAALGSWRLADGAGAAERAPQTAASFGAA